MIELFDNLYMMIGCGLCILTLLSFFIQYFKPKWKTKKWGWLFAWLLITGVYLLIMIAVPIKRLHTEYEFDEVNIYEYEYNIAVVVKNDPRLIGEYDQYIDVKPIILGNAIFVHYQAVNMYGNTVTEYLYVKRHE